MSCNISFYKLISSERIQNEINKINSRMIAISIVIHTFDGLYNPTKHTLNLPVLYTNIEFLDFMKKIDITVAANEHRTPYYDVLKSAIIWFADLSYSRIIADYHPNYWKHVESYQNRNPPPYPYKYRKDLYDVLIQIGILPQEIILNICKKI
jgi:hypothetical protein